MNRMKRTWMGLMSLLAIVAVASLGMGVVGCRHHGDHPTSGSYHPRTMAPAEHPNDGAEHVNDGAEHPE